MFHRADITQRLVASHIRRSRYSTARSYRRIRARQNSKRHDKLAARFAKAEGRWYTQHCYSLTHHDDTVRYDAHSVRSRSYFRTIRALETREEHVASSRSPVECEAIWRRRQQLSPARRAVPAERCRAAAETAERRRR